MLRSLYSLRCLRSRGQDDEDEGDYESPNDHDAEDDGDYESPNEEDQAPVEDDADYEPPPSNDEEALQNSILPAKPFSNSNSMYIGKDPAVHPGPSPQPLGPGPHWAPTRLWASGSTSLGLSFLSCETG